MSHTIIETEEFQKIKSALTKLSNGSSICETSKNGKPLRTWQVKNSKLVVWKDHIEHDRSFKKEEEAAFLAKLNKEYIAKFFVNYEDSDVPYREYSACCDAEYGLFKNAMHAGTYRDGLKRYNVFKVLINKDQDPEDAATEVEYILALQKKRFPKQKVFWWDIFEHTLSYRASFGLEIDVDGPCSLVKSYSEPIKFNSLVEALEYIRQNHWYEEITES